MTCPPLSFSVLATLAALTLPGGGCAQTSASGSSSSSTTSSQPPASAAAAASSSAAPGGHDLLPFIADDYPKARALAQKTGRPLFVDAWAPWCHTCLSLRQYVFTDPGLARWKDRFVWLAIDTEKDSNAAFVKARPIDTWPTLFVIDPNSEAIRAIWRGALTAAEMGAWLEEATGAPAAAGIRERAAEAHVVELRRRGDSAACVAEAESVLRQLLPGTSRLNVAIEGLTCAQRLPSNSHQRAGSAAALAQLIDDMIADPKFPILPDDRSNGYATLVEAAQEAQDKPRVLALATRWMALLDQLAGQATTPAVRAVFDAHRTQAALALGRPQLAIAALEQSARDFPDDYNPPHRLARLYLVAGRLSDARVAIDRALALVYGPRRKRVEQLQAEIEKAEAAAAVTPRAAP